MQYSIDIQHYRIHVTGTTDEIRNMIIALDKVITKGTAYSQLEQKLNNLENTIDEETYKFNIYERIDYKNNYLMISTDATLSARSYWFRLVQEHFDQAVLLLKQDE